LNFADSTIPHANFSWAILFAAAAGFPLALRLLSGSKHSTRQRLPYQLVLVLLLQDLVVAGQVSVAAATLFAWLPSPLAGAVLAGIFLASVHFCVVADSVLWRRFNCRFSLHFLTYAGDLGLFAKSSRKIGIDLRLLAAGFWRMPEFSPIY
jgi:hypothetical protein